MTEIDSEEETFMKLALDEKDYNDWKFMKELTLRLREIANFELEYTLYNDKNKTNI